MEQQPRIRASRPEGPPEHRITATVPATVYRASASRGRREAPVVLALRRMPNPRLTGLGGGIFSAAVMFMIGCLDSLLFDGGPLMYGLLFLPVGALTALWVRPADLVTAPISAPIAFAFGALPITDSGGFGGRLMALITTLALNAGWLYGGTLVAGVIATVRKVRQIRRRYR